MELYRNIRTGTYHWVDENGPICRTSSNFNPARYEIVQVIKDSLPVLMCQECERRHRFAVRMYHAQTVD